MKDRWDIARRGVLSGKAIVRGKSGARTGRAIIQAVCLLSLSLSLWLQWRHANARHMQVYELNDEKPDSRFSENVPLYSVGRVREMCCR